MAALNGSSLSAGVTIISPRSTRGGPGQQQTPSTQIYDAGCYLSSHALAPTSEGMSERPTGQASAAFASLWGQMSAALYPHSWFLVDID